MMANSPPKDILLTMRIPIPENPHSESALSQSGAPVFLWVLVGIMATIELGISLSASGIIGTLDLRSSAFLFGAFWQPVFSGLATPLYSGQTLLMFITYAFLHGGVMHLVMNSVVLLSLGKFVTIHIGVNKTLLVLFLSTIAGAACFGLVSSSNGPMIGASGAVFGLIGIWQAMEYKALQRSGLSVRPVFMAFLGLVVANILIFVMLSGGLAWEAHLGGWLAGWFSGNSFARRSR